MNQFVPLNGLQIFMSCEPVPYDWNTFVLCSMEGYMEKVKMASLDRARRKLSSEVQKLENFVLACKDCS